MKISASIISPTKYPNLQFSSKKKNEESQKPDVAVLASTIAGTIIPMLVIRKYQCKSLKSGELKGLDLNKKAKTVLKSLDIEYGLKEMLFTSFGSIAGGLFGGLALHKNDERDKKAKIKESVFQFSNILIPTSFVAGLLKLSEKAQGTKGVLLKIASILVGVGVGMPLAASISNNLNNAVIDKEHPDTRKLKLKDAFVHVDDLVGAVALTKIPLLDKLHIDKILPLLYGMCGYESGTKKS